MWLEMNLRRNLNVDRQEHNRSDRARERGATAVEYAMLFSLVIGTTVLAIQTLTTESGDYLSTTGDDIGEPRERIANMDPDLPDPPAWLP